EFFIDRPIQRSYRRLCYYGTLWSAIDYAPIKALAEAGFDITLIGPEKESLPKLPANVRHEPAKPYARLPSALERFAALLLPYRRSPYNRGVVPAKLFECLATGCPVIASPLPALEPVSEFLYVAGSSADWVKAVEDLSSTESEQRRKA